MLFGYTPSIRQPADIFVGAPKSTKAYSINSLPRAARHSLVITLEANQRSVEQCLEKGLPTQSLRLRLIRVELEDGEVEVLITHLMDEQAFPASEFKELYHLRWGPKKTTNASNSG